MSNKAIPIRWGDIIRIHGVNKQDKNKSKGLIICKGFTDPNLYYQKYDNFEDVNLYRQSLFQILPVSSLDLSDKYLELPDNHPQKQDYKQKSQGEIEKLYSVLDSKTGQQIYVKYGSQIIFKHLQSNAFLRGLLKASDAGDGAFLVQVIKSPCTNSVFQIKSHRTYEQEGKNIYYDDELQIFHERADCYMNFSGKQQPIYLDVKQQLVNITQQNYPEQYQFFKNRPQIKKPITERIAVINQNKDKCLWKLIQHCSYEKSKEKDLIKSHDIVYFEHTRNKGLISSTLAYPSYYLKQFPSEQQDKVSYQCFWQLIPKSEKSSKFYAKNMVTGQLLVYGSNQFVVQIKNKDEEQVGFIDKGLVNLICSPPVPGEEEDKLDKGEQMEKDTTKEKIVQVFQEKNFKFHLKSVKYLRVDSFTINRVDESTMTEIGFALSSHEPLVKFLETISNKLIRIQYPTPGRGRQRQIYADRPELKYAQFWKDLDESKLLIVSGILKALSGRIYGTYYENIVKSGNTPKKQIQKIFLEVGLAQLAIQIIFYLFKPLQSIKNQEMGDNKLEKNRCEQIFKTSYQLLEKIAASNDLNRIYISRWIQMMLKHSNQLDRDYIQNCIVGILQNNPVSIKYTINEKIIHEQIDNCIALIELKRKGPDQLSTKYLKLFETFIKCEGYVLRQNQKCIHQHFFKNDDNKMIFQFKIVNKERDKNEKVDQSTQIAKLQGQQVLITMEKDYYTLTKFYKDWKGRWNYFMAYVNLLADICIDRNAESISSIEKSITLKTIAVILHDPQIRKLNETIASISSDTEKPPLVKNVHEPFLRIAHHAYINNSNFTPIKKIKKIANWYRQQLYSSDGKPKEEINRTKRQFEGDKQQEEKRLLGSVLSYVEEFLKKWKQNKDSLSILDITLGIFEVTLQLGLWDYIRQFRDMIPDLVMKITKINDDELFQEKGLSSNLTGKEVVKNNKAALRMNRPEITKAIECRKRATNIYRAMSEMETDIRLRLMMRFFKGIYLCTQKCDKYYEPQVQAVKSQQQITKERNKIARQLYYKDYQSKNQSSIFNNALSKLSEDQDKMLDPNLWYNKFKEITPFTACGDLQNTRYLFQSMIKEGKYSFDKVVLALFELSGYNNYKLLENALNMLRAMFQQRRSLINNFNCMLICGKGKLFDIYNTMKTLRNKFNMLTNPQIVKYGSDQRIKYNFEFWKPLDILEKKPENRTGIIQDLFYLARTLKQGVDLKYYEDLITVNRDVFATNKVATFINERQQPNGLFQAINLAEGVYAPLITYIRRLGEQEVITQPHRELLYSIYQYLTLLCYNNLEVKQVLMEYIPDFIKHLNKKVGAANLIYQVALSNKLLVNNEYMVKIIIDGILYACMSLMPSESVLTKYEEEENYNELEISQLLFCLRGILIFNDSGLRRNQEAVLNRLQDSKFRRLIFQQRILPSEKPPNVYFSLTPHQTYIATVFELFATLVESENLINIGKLQNMHKYTYLLENIKSTNQWQIRRALRAYLNRLYYVIKDKQIFMFEQFYRQQFGIINKEIQELVDIHSRKILTSRTEIKNGVRFTYARSQMYLMALEILITLNEMFNKPDFVKMLQDQIKHESKFNDKKLHNQLTNLMKNLAKLKKMHDKIKPICSILQQVQNFVSKIAQQFSLQYLIEKGNPAAQIGEQGQLDQLEQGSDKKTFHYDKSKSFFRNFHDMIREAKAAQRLKDLRKRYEQRMNSEKQGIQNEVIKKKRLIHDLLNQCPDVKPIHIKPKKIVGALQFNPYIRTADSKLFKVRATKPDSNEDQMNYTFNQKLSSLKKMVQQHPKFQKFQEDQFVNLVNIFSSIKQNSIEYYKPYWQKISLTRSGSTPEEVFSMDTILETTFSLIVEHIDEISDTQKIFVVKLARTYITQAIEKDQCYKLPIDVWDPEYFGEEKETQYNRKLVKSFVQRQQQIMKCGGSVFLTKLLQQKNLGDSARIELFNETLLLGIAFVYNGNSECQKSIYQVLRQDASNSMLININELISSISTFLIQTRSLLSNQKKRQFNYKICDIHTYYNLDENIMVKQTQLSNDRVEMKIQEAFQKALSRIFRFLQLLCQKNNISLKKFLLEQTNQDDKRKDGTINFINSGCSLLTKYFKMMNDRLATGPLAILQFLIEITQIPCLANQKSFLQLPFFEDISNMALFFEKAENLRDRKIKTTPQEYQNPQSPINILMAINQKAITLALNNFEGHADTIYYQFLHKCQPKFIWITMRNNIYKILDKQVNSHYFVGSYKKPQKQNAKQLEQKKEPQGDDQKEMKEEQKKQEELQYCEPTSAEKLKQFKVEHMRQIIKNQIAQYQVYQDEFASIISCLCILKKINDYYLKNQKEGQHEKAQKAKNFADEFNAVAKEDFQAINDFMTEFNKLILHIQVNSDNGQSYQLQNVYFPNNPVYSQLSKDTKNTIMYEVVRETQRDKLVSLLGFKQEVYQQIQVNYELKYNTYNFNLLFWKPSWSYQITAEKANFYRTNARTLSVVICVLLLLFIFVDHDMQNQSSSFVFTSPIIGFFVQSLCRINLLLTLWFFYLYIKLRKPIVLNKFDNQEQQKPYVQAVVQIKLPQQPADGWAQISQTMVVYKQFFADRLSQVTSLLKQNFLYRELIKPIIALYLFENSFLSILIFIFTSIMGNFLGVEWFTLHLFDYFASISELSNVFKAITLKINELTLLTALSAAFILVFNIVTLNTYAYVIYQDEQPTEYCQGLFECAQVLYLSGAIGDSMDEFDGWRFGYDTVNNVFMGILFSNLISGLMIDGYGQLVQKDQERTKDMETYCYICGLSKPEMQKQSEFFNTHIARHDLWNYLYYIHNLKRKAKNDYSGLQFSINQKLDAEDVIWFPDNTEGGDDGALQKIVQEFKENLEQMTKKGKQLTKLGEEALDSAKDGLEKNKIQRIEA